MIRPLLASGLAYIAVTLLMGANVLGRLSVEILGDRGDPVFVAAILAWNATHVPWTEAWFDFPAFYPAPDMLTLSEHLLGVSVLATPIYWLTGNAVFTHNATTLATHVLCGMAMFALVWRLTTHGGAAFVAGLAYAFAPYRASQIGHLQVLTAFWAPLALLGLHAFLGTGRRSWLAVFGICWMLQGAASGYFLVYFSLLVAFWVLWFVVIARRWKELALILAAAMVSVLPLAPVLARSASIHERYGFSRGLQEVVVHSADVTAVLCAAPRLITAHDLGGTCRGEGELFPGIALIALCGAGLALWLTRRRRDRDAAPIGFYAVAALLMWVFTWGPSPTLHGQRWLEHGPYSALMLLPGVDSLRVPARFWMMAALCLSVLLGLTLAAALRHRARMRWAVALLAGTAVTLEGWHTWPMATLLPGPPRPDLLRNGVVMTLPLGESLEWETAAQFEAVRGGWRAVNGYSGYEPPQYQALRELSMRADPALLTPFVAQADLHIVVRESSPTHVELVERQPGVEFVAGAGGLRQYRLAKSGD